MDVNHALYVLLYAAGGPLLGFLYKYPGLHSSFRHLNKQPGYLMAIELDRYRVLLLKKGERRWAEC